MGLLTLTSCKDRNAEELNAKLANGNLLSAPTTNSPSGNISNPAATADSNDPDNNDPNNKFREIQMLEKQGHFASALEKATSVVQAEPKNVSAYIVRGHIYTEMNQLDQAGDDYRTILQLDPNNFSAKFNLSELKLIQKEYDDARIGFLALESNPDWGDLAAYKVFVCDLFAGHEDVAKSEFDTFDKAKQNASYYYSKATWEFYHNRPLVAQTWIDAAAWMYPPKKVYFYSATLIDFGYLKPTQQSDQLH